MKYNKKILSAIALICLTLSSCGKPVSEELPTMTVQSVSGTTEEAIPVEATVSETTSQATASETEKTSFSVTDPSQYPTDYDKEYFSQDLFIGDSITTGFAGYGFIPEKNVFAKVGLNPVSILTTPITTSEGDILIDAEIADTLPKRAYIMLGSNGIEWLKNDSMIDDLDKLVKIINDKSPDTKIVILSVTPVTKEFEEKSKAENCMQKILDYNKALSDFCSKNSLMYIDITTMLMNEDGYFSDYFAESDGMHFKGDTYKVVLSYIQKTLEASEKNNG